MPPEPMAAMPSSGSITSPVPETIKSSSLVATINSASSLCMILSLLQSCASETAARVRLPLNCSSFFSNRSQSENASATDPAKPTTT